MNSIAFPEMNLYAAICSARRAAIARQQWADRESYGRVEMMVGQGGLKF
jgi:hypothetical protein